MERRARTISHLGAIIRRERRTQGLTQVQLGDKIGMRQATISKLESGEPKTELKTLFDALSALGLEILVTERRESSKDDIERLF